MSHLETAGVLLVHCNNINKDYQHNSIVLHIFVPNKLHDNYQIIAKIYVFKKH